MKSNSVRRVAVPLPCSAPGVRPGPPNDPLTILVALADADRRAVSLRILEQAGFRVLTARHSGHALLACLTTARIDVLLTDLRMEDGPGRLLTERLRRHNPDLRGVYFSDDSAEAGDDVLGGPVTADALLRAVTGERGREA